MKDPYSSLGVAKDADASEVKKAFRKLTQEHHPDKNPGDKASEERFKDVSQAYEILGDSDRRKLFDEFGEMSLTQGFDAQRARAYNQARSGHGGMRGGFGPGMGGFDLGGYGNARETSFDDLLSSLFGGGSINLGDNFGRPAGPRKGSDISGEVQISFERALEGSTVPLRVDSGGETKTLDVKIPMGVKDGAKLRLRGQGGAGRPKGDILLTIRVESSSRWTRKGDNIEGVLHVPALAAYRGGPVDVETPWGEVTMKLPAGTQGGQTLRLKGRGVRFAGDKRRDGNLFVRVQIVLPEAGDEGLVDALERLQGVHEPLEEEAEAEAEAEPG